jgi:hypothetical protein
MKEKLRGKRFSQEVLPCLPLNTLRGKQIEKFLRRFSYLRRFTDEMKVCQLSSSCLFRSFPDFYPAIFHHFLKLKFVQFFLTAWETGRNISLRRKLCPSRLYVDSPTDGQNPKTIPFKETVAQIYLILKQLCVGRHLLVAWLTSWN